MNAALFVTVKRACGAWTDACLRRQHFGFVQSTRSHLGRLLHTHVRHGLPWLCLAGGGADHVAPRYSATSSTAGPPRSDAPHLCKPRKRGFASSNR